MPSCRLDRLPSRTLIGLLRSIRKRLVKVGAITVRQCLDASDGHRQSQWAGIETIRRGVEKFLRNILSASFHE